MATEKSIAVIAQLGLIQSVDSQRPFPGDHWRLPDWLRQQVQHDLTALEESDAATVLSEGERTGCSGGSRAAIEELEGLLRDAYRGIGAIRRTAITDAQRSEVYASYGWARGLLGRLSPDRIVALARLGVRKHPNVSPEFQYPPELAADMTRALATYDAFVAKAGTGARETATSERNANLLAARQTLRQVRHWYCAASRDGSQSKELSKIGFQPRRDRRTKEAVAAEAQRKQARKEQKAARQQARLAAKQAAAAVLRQVSPQTAATNGSGGVPLSA